MKRSVLMLMLVMSSASALAIVEGTPIDWSQHDNTVLFSGCTGTAIAGHYVLTAAHCRNGSYIVDAAQKYNENFVLTLHPHYVDKMISEDVAIATFKQPLSYQRIQFFKDLSTPTFVQDELITIDGFGGTNKMLSRAEFKLSNIYSVNYPFHIDAIQTGKASTTGGDSGSAWINSDNEIIGVHHGSSITSPDVIGGTDLHYARDFILETIDGWHYPTKATVNGRTTIEVQSLHLNGGMDSAYVSGDVKLLPNDSSCVASTLSPFERCTYTIESQGGEGQLYLSDREVININPVLAEEAPPSHSHEDEGGSVSLWSVMALTLLGLRRRYFSALKVAQC